MGISYENGQAKFLALLVCQHQITLPGSRMLELGNQRIRECLLGYEVPAKQLFTALGVDHVSIDLNGLDGALPLDLGQPLPTDLGVFDIVTNFGCIEHVENQYQAWRNVHDACDVGRPMVHSLPQVGSWPKHGIAWYTMGMIRELATAAGWSEEIIYVHERTQPHRTLHSIMCCFIRGVLPFVSEQEFDEIMQ